MYGHCHTLKVDLFIAYVLLMYGLAHTLKEHLFTLYVLVVYGLSHIVTASTSMCSVNF